MSAGAIAPYVQGFHGGVIEAVDPSFLMGERTGQSPFRLTSTRMKVVDCVPRDCITKRVNGRREVPMTYHRILASIFFLASFAGCALAEAPSPSECRDVLKAYNTSWTQKTFTERLATLNLVDTSKWSEEQKNYKADVPEYFSGSADEFKSSREKLFNLSSYNRDTYQSGAELLVYLPDEAVKAWSSCINRDKIGLIVQLVSLDELGASIEFVWNNPDGLDKVTLEIETDNVAPGSKLDSPIQLSAAAKKAGEFAIKRKDKALPSKIIARAVTVTPSSATYSAHLYIPPKLPKPISPCVQTDGNGRCLACYWDLWSARGSQGTERTLACPHMKSGKGFLRAVKTQQLQEGWKAADTGQLDFQNAQEFKRGDYKWSNRMAGKGYCSPSAYPSLDQPLGTINDDEQVEVTWTAQACSGCGGTYDCGIDLHKAFLQSR
ncbi:MULTISPECIES: hypothetical protein [unclassified Bradyrhizobium]|uniref:hypothetical protein n=1 Tax=unclassified Bradyrhizobium TaxID=2631580 RepID=UPI0028E8BE45|nr:MULTISPECIES: hypothetical protein [unclassified Bradyrhizobium]